MAKTETYTQYAAFCKKSSGRWAKINSFYCKSVSEAERAIVAHKKLFPDFQYKVMSRKVTTTTEEWSDCNV